MQKDAITGDEIVYPPAGYSYLLYHRYDINFEHAPFLKMWMALPYFFLQPKLEPKSVENSSQWDFGRDFFFKNNGSRTEELLLSARMMILLLTAGFALFLFWGIKRWWGIPAACISTCIYAFSPNILANGRLATLDSGVMVFMFVALYFFISWWKKPGYLYAILTGIAFGVAQTAKFTALFLVPVFLITGLVYILFYIRKKFWNPQRAVQLGVGLFSAFLSIWLIYGISAYQTPPEWVSSKIQEVVPATNDALKTPADLVRLFNGNDLTRPLAVYGLGILRSYTYTKGPITNFLQYLWGDFSEYGWWYYYLAAYVVKEPLPILLALPLALILIVYVSLKKKKVDLPLAGIIIAVILTGGLMSLGNLNIGLRYFLPVFPLIYTILGYAAMLLFKYVRSKTKQIQIALGSLLIVLGGWLVWENVRIFPSYLAYFNQLAGGPEKGYAYLIDSNIDWGQGLVQLATWAKAHPDKKLYIDYFGQGELSHYLKDIEYENWHVARGFPEDGYLAISVNYFTTSKYWKNKGNETVSYEPLEQVEPLARIGYAMNVYGPEQFEEARLLESQK